MTNLIPPSARIQVQREYWIRVVSVWFFLLGSACITVAILNVPVYVLVKNQLGSFNREYQQASSATQSFEISEKAINEALSIGKLLSSVETVEPFTGVIKELETLAGGEVTIKNYTLSRTDGKISSIVITGEAKSRLALSEFRTQLENTPKFATAKLPLSNLAKDKDIPFSITIATESAEAKKETPPKP